MYLGIEFDVDMRKNPVSIAVDKDIDNYKSSLLQAYLNKYKVPMKADVIRLELEGLYNVLYGLYIQNACGGRVYKYFPECVMVWNWFKYYVVFLATSESQQCNKTLVIQ
jgi:hypothetical protein